ncbi:FAD-dependent oxidoreductase [Flavitalea flava]
MKKYILPLICLFACHKAVFAQQAVPATKNAAVYAADICIYGGTSSGVIAAYTAAKSGKKVILIEPGRHLGGMTTGGLGYTDIGNKYVVTGLARDFYRRIGAHYGKFEQWIFEPKVAEGIIMDYVKRAGFTVLRESRLKEVKKEGNQIKEIILENSHNPAAVANTTVRAKVFMDCTYEGDLMARSGVSYSVGREANSQYNETINGVEFMEGHQFPDNISPYRVPGDPKSGLLWGIGNQSLPTNGTGDKEVQAYNFRITLTNVPENRIPVSMPENYSPDKYELLLRLKEKQPWKTFKDVFIWSMMPNGKTDINNKGGFSTDMIGMNWEYPEAGYDKRAEIWKEHEDYTKGLLYFVGNDARIPDYIRSEIKQWGYPKDEYMDNGNWSHQLYVREARRMIGELVMTDHHCRGKELIKDGVGMAAYGMDSHNCERLVENGQVKNEGNVEVHGFAPYSISYRALIPKEKEAGNLLVPVCLSATHIAYGSIRMEPVFMVLGQSAAIAACKAIDEKVPVQQVNVNEVQKVLKNNPLADGSIPEILVDNEDSGFVLVKGNWKTEKNGGYGPSFFFADSKTQADSKELADSKARTPESVRFIPEILKKEAYQVYAYFPKLLNASTKTYISIFDGRKVIEKSINSSYLQVEGQTSGEWVSLGLYTLLPGRKAYVEISNKNADGVIAADAVLFVPVR